MERGGRGVDENRFGTVRQENKMCRIEHLLKLFFLRILGCLIRFSHNLEVTVHNTAGNLVKSLGVKSSCPTTTTLMYLCTKLSHCFWLCPAQSREKHQGGIENDGGSSLSSHSYIVTHSKEALDAVSRYIECQIGRPLRCCFSLAPSAAHLPETNTLQGLCFILTL